MSEAIIAPPKLHAFHLHRRSPSRNSSAAASLSFPLRPTSSLHHVRIRSPTWLPHSSYTLDGQSRELVDDDSPASVKLEPISGEAQFDRILAEAQQLEEPIVVVWMAGWCRKCIYLKPKMEKLAAHYYPRIRFYCVDVNVVPQRLVNRAGITKMPTIQVWRDGNKQAEVIGGHKAWMVVNDVREMIENES